METPDSKSAPSADKSDIEQEIEHLTNQINYEEQQWAQGGLHLGMVNINPHLLLIRVTTLVRIIQERLEMSDPEIELIFKEEILKQLQSDRKMILEARTNQLVVAQAQILGANGQPLSN